MNFTEYGLNFFSVFFLNIKEDLKFHSLDIQLKQINRSDFLIFEVVIEVFTLYFFKFSFGVEK